MRFYPNNLLTATRVCGVSVARFYFEQGVKMLLHKTAITVTDTYSDFVGLSRAEWTTEPC